MRETVRLDVGRIRAEVGRQGLTLVRDHLFPIIVEEAVSQLKTPNDMLATAGRVRDHMRVAGVTNARVIQHEGCYPAVFGEIKADLPNAPTILVGGHFDGQPSAKNQWTVTQPHEPKFVTQGGETRVFGRGTSDDWGQVLTHVMAVKMIRDLGLPLPVNIKFLIEGGEETGSPNMDKFVKVHLDLLKCDLVILTDSAPGRPGIPVITTMARGLVGADVKLEFGTNDPHSGDSLTYSVVDVLSRILALKNLKTMRVGIPGFYDRVRPMTDPAIARLIEMPFDVDHFIRMNGLTGIVTLDNCSAQAAMWAQPTYQVHTILDPQGEAIPHTNKLTTRAQAYVTMRLVADQDPKEIFELFSREVYRRLVEETNLGPETLTIKAGHVAYPFSTDVTGPTFDAIALSMSEAFGVHQVDFAGCGGTEPIAMYYQTILGVPVVFNAYNDPSDHYHGNDESFSIDRGFKPGIIANVLVYQRLYDLGNTQQ